MWEGHVISLLILAPVTSLLKAFLIQCIDSSNTILIMCCKEMIEQVMYYVFQFLSLNSQTDEMNFHFQG